MKFSSYLKDHFLHLVIGGAFIAFLALCLSLYAVDTTAILYLIFLYLITESILLGCDYLRRYHFYKSLMTHIARVDQKTLIVEFLDRPALREQQLIYEVLKTCTRSMNDTISEERNRNREYREYIETWVHEIKTPIASAKLIAENNPGPASAPLKIALGRIEDDVTQALFYSRSNTVSQDYIIKKTTLQDLLNPVLREKAATFIGFKIALSLDNLDLPVYTDSKWMLFILGQLLDNALKYLQPESDKRITLSGSQDDNCVILTLKDNGIGIPEKDLPRVFEKGFTGDNGRVFGNQSTGLGLYLCKRLCNKMGLAITIESKPSQGTTLRIFFPTSEDFRTTT